MTAFFVALIDAARVHVDILRQDVRQTFRGLRRSPGFALAAITVTILGVGATTAAFTLTDHVLLRPLPFPDSERLVKVLQGSTTRPANLRGLRGTNEISPGLYYAWRASASFSTFGVYGLASSNLSGDGEPERLDGANITATGLEAVGVTPALGRGFSAADDAENAPCTVIIGDGLWRRRFGGDRAVLGRTLRIDDESCEVIGVMPAGFNFPYRSTSFWRPLRFTANRVEDFGDTYLRGIARLRPGVSFEGARAELETLAASQRQTWPQERAMVAPVMIRVRDELNDQSRMLVVAMACAAGCLLLIACTNLASLMIARATARGRELALRTVLGAGQRRLVRQLLTESLVLAMIGGSIGLALAVSVIPVAAKLVPSALPITEIPAVDLRMLLIALVATLGTGIAFGVLPAFRAARRVAGGDLRDSSRTGSGRTSSRLRDGLVVLQVAASIVLLVGTGLLVRALISVQSTPAGFTTERVMTARTFLPWSKYGEQARRVEFYRRVLDEVSAIPGVSAAGYTSYLPFTFRGGVWGVVLPGQTLEPGRTQLASSRFVTPAYFEAMGIPALGGRAFDESDSLQSQPVAIVSQSFVTSYLQGREPIGQTFQFGPAGERTIVGVVGDVRFRGLEVRNEPQVYMPYQQQGDNRTMGYTPKDLVVRLRADDAGTAAMDGLPSAIRRIVANADRDQPVSDIQPLETLLAGETVSRKVQVRVLAGFAAVSCLLAGVGLHGLLAFVVARRTREFGVRLALGAQPRQILGLVARRGLMLGGLGVAAGVWFAYLAGRSMEALLAGLSPADPLTVSAAVALSIVITIAGSLLPAIRAARINPKQAIEVE